MLPPHPLLALLTEPSPPGGWMTQLPGGVGVAIALTLVTLPPLIGLLYLGYFLFSTPLRRQERARLLLDLIETAVERGDSLEATLLGAAAQRERRLGQPFRRLADRLTGGLRFPQALELTPGLLPASVSAMLRAGFELGDLRKVLPNCRRLLRDGSAQVAHAHHYLMVLAFATSPAWIGVFGMMCVFVLPKLRQIAYDMSDTPPLPGILEGMLTWSGPLVAGQVVFVATLWLAVILYCGGPRLTDWLTRRLPFSWDGLAILMPWKRHRLQRDFSTLLAVALDAGLPEARAVMLAGEGTGNEVFRERALAAVGELHHGVPLPEALARLDHTGQFRWRLANAALGRGGFLAALSGWQEALDARAFRQEQTVAQLATTALVVLNGLLVGLLAVGVFQLLVNLLWSAVLW